MTPYQQAIQQLNQKYSGTTTISAPSQPTTLQKVGNFAAGVGKAVVNPFARVGVQAYNTTAGIIKAASGDVAGGSAELDKPRNLPLLGEVKPVLTNSSKPGLNQALDIAGQGIQLGTAGAAPEFRLGSGIVGGIKTGAALGATQGLGSALTETEGKSFGQNVGNVAQQTAFGGLTGGIIGGGTAAIHPIFTRSTPILDPKSVELQTAEEGVINAQSNLKSATQARQLASEQGINAMNQMNQQVGQFKSSLGTNFEQGAKTIEQTKPGLTLDLTGKQLDALNNLKESKNFTLPENLDNSSAGATIGGSEFKIGNPQIAAQLEGLQNKTATSLTPTQTQDLIRRLNKLTFDAKASGDLAVNQQTIGLTNEIKEAASKTFGTEWNNVYANYAKGINAVESLNDIVNLDANATPTDINNSFNKILKLGKTPEGKIILQQALEEFKNTSGIDLSDPTKAIHQILDKQLALSEAQDTLSTSQKELSGVQKTQALEQKKAATFKGRHPYIAQNLKYDLKRIAIAPVMYGIYKGLNALYKSMEGK